METRINIYLTEQQLLKLDEIIEITGLPKAEILRRSLDLYYEKLWEEEKMRNEILKQKQAAMPYLTVADLSLSGEHRLKGEIDILQKIIEANSKNKHKPLKLVFIAANGHTLTYSIEEIETIFVPGEGHFFLKLKDKEKQKVIHSVISKIKVHKDTLNILP